MNFYNFTYGGQSLSKEQDKALNFEIASLKENLDCMKRDIQS